MIRQIYRQAYVFMERRWASPGWRQVTHLGEAIRYLLFTLWRRKAGPDRFDTRQLFCPAPFEKFELQENGSVYLCCPTWMPRPAGDINAEDPRAVWNSKTAQAIRASILDGSFKYCRLDICPRFQSGRLPTRAEARRDPRYRRIIDDKVTQIDRVPRQFNLSHDRSCNLSCPSCRTKKINFPKGPEYDTRQRLQDRLFDAFFAEPHADEVVVNVTGGGDPIASRVFREFLETLDVDPFPNLSIHLQTNGVLLTEKMWRRMSNLHGRVHHLHVSVDAASAPTYAIVRRGGDWGQLLKNMDFLATARRRGEFGNFRIDFVVQLENFREMGEFVALGKRWGVDEITFSGLTNWGTWTNDQYARRCVWDPGHPEYRDFIEAVNDPRLSDPIVDLGNLSAYHTRSAGREPVPAS